MLYALDAGVEGVGTIGGEAGSSPVAILAKKGCGCWYWTNARAHSSQAGAVASIDGLEQSL